MQEICAKQRHDFMSRVLSVQSELSNYRADKQIKTRRSRQAYYIHWMNQFGLKDPCRDYIVKNDALLVFLKSLILGENIRNKDSIRANNIAEYTKESNCLHKM